MNKFSIKNIILLALFSLGACNDSGGGSSSSGVVVEYTRAYVANESSNSVSFCSASTNGLSNCTPLSDATFNTPTGIVLNSAKTFAYVANYNAGVSICPVNANGTFASCQDSGVSFNSPIGVAFDPAQTHIYITNDNGGSSSVTYCLANGTTGLLSSCQTLTANSLLNAAEGIAINQAGSFAYIIDNLGGGSNSEITYCPIQAGGTFGTCSDTGSDPHTNPEMITLNPTGTYAFIPNAANGSVDFCSISQTDGSVGTCNDSGVGNFFSGPKDVRFNAAGTAAFVTSNTDSNVYACTIDGVTGGFSVCSGTGSGFDSPWGIFLD